MIHQEKPGLFARIRRRSAIFSGAVLAAMAFFLILPVLQVITGKNTRFWEVRDVELANLPPPPPPPPEEQEEEEEEEEEPPPEQLDELPPLDLAQIELGLQGGGDGAGLFNIRNLLGGAELDDALEDALGGGVDQQPRPIFRSSPRYPPNLFKKKVEGIVYIEFVVDETGRVLNPRVTNNSEPEFEKAALNAIRKWKFEPAKSSGKAVKFKMRQPIRFSLG